MHHEQDSCGFGLLVDIALVSSNRLISRALQGLARLTHRGAVGEDGLSGDGCGIMLELDQNYFTQQALEAGITLRGRLAVAMCFLTPAQCLQQQNVLEKNLTQLGFNIAGWREVPTNESVLGTTARQGLPVIRQLFVEVPTGLTETLIEKRLFLAQKQSEWALRQDNDFCICSLSCLTVTYKALVLPGNLPLFYPDLQDHRWCSKVALFHQRFSTNTLSRWKLAQPFSTLAHNGEINTIRGNRSYAEHISPQLISAYYPELDVQDTLLSSNASDSMSLDQLVQSYHHFGFHSAEILRLLLPPAWENNPQMSDAERNYFRYHFPMLPSWEGPAGLVFYDGHYAGCILDRNGFRPARYQRSHELIAIGSESGLIDFEADELLQQSRIKPGDMFLMDTRRNQILCEGSSTPEFFIQRHPYTQWTEDYYKTIAEDESHHSYDSESPLETIHYKYFDVSYEEIEQSLLFMAKNAMEPTASMGDDTPVAVLSLKPRQLFDFMRQQFAQVTNPPLDSLREKNVMSMMLSLGPRSFIGQREALCKPQLLLNSPLLSRQQYQQLRTKQDTHFQASTLMLSYDLIDNLQTALQKLKKQALSLLNDKHLLLILSDEETGLQRPSIHPALAVGFLHEALMQDHSRDKVSLLVASGWIRDTHHLAMTLASGANAVFPWLAYRIIEHNITDSWAAKQNYREAMNKGLLKICSKMGVCTVNSYQGSRLFQILGLKKNIVRECFGHSAFAIERLDWQELTRHQQQFFHQAMDISIAKRHGGLYKYNFDGEYHDFNPEVVTTLIEAVKLGDRSLFEHYSQLINQRPRVMIRDFYHLQSDKKPIDIDRVEPIEAIRTRFETAAMSLGALSPEAHESLAEAMNTLGGRSNSGEGGEAAFRHNSIKRSKIKQIASGRFGVTAKYLMQAEVLQIKMAQGAKPGEGGQLPGTKVNPMIAELRYCSPGTSLISPPPHHDIYSIEDLAQLIFDLKQINPKAFVSVKLVSAPGVGTIAAGVVKAYADSITLSGYDGGTGASPLSSIRYTGCPWELGLIETQQILLDNNLRHRICLQVDGGFKTGMDVVKAALLGAETFGFGTAPVVALGCKYLRICHLNNCATGVATQHPVLRSEHYHGSAARVIRFFNWIAEEVQSLIAQMGYSTLQELIGRHDLLGELPDCPHPLAPLHPSQSDTETRSRFYQQGRNPSFDSAPLATTLLLTIKNSLEEKTTVCMESDIHNHDRSIGANIAGVLSELYPNNDAPEDLVTLHFTGTAGQSFAVWNVQGMTLTLTGVANDYVGKGMNGGRVILCRASHSKLPALQYCLAGNTCLYGATGGECYIDGQAGERFAVRNSGVRAVVAAIGYHGCEYMTGGRISILSCPDKNFAAGMTGGIAFVFDDRKQLEQNINPETVTFAPLRQLKDQQYLALFKQDLLDFIHHTQSALGKSVLEELELGNDAFYIIYPKELQLSLSTRQQEAS